jgi:chromate transporter
MREHPALDGALAAITGVVVGVILNLAVWFALHVVFARVVTWTGFGLELSMPDPASLDPAAAVLTVGALLAVFRWRVGMAPLLLIWAALGLAWRFLGGAF